VAYTYPTFVTALASEMAVDPSNADFLTILPTLIDTAEQLCYRELDLLAALVTVTATASANNRLLTLPTGSGHLLVVDSVAAIDAGGTRHMMVPATRETIDFLYPTNTASFSPSYPSIFARYDDLTLIYGPPPDSGYTVEIVSTIRPAALTAVNTATYLSQYLPDLFLAAAMVSAMGWMKNFGAQSDDPKSSVSWQNEYNVRLASAQKEERRKQYVAAMSSPPVSQKDV